MPIRRALSFACCSPALGASDLPSEFLSGYGAVTETTTLTPFTLEEAVGYFIDKRRLNPSHPLNEMWLASGGNPFMLSLFAEMAASRRSLTADEVKKIKNPQLAYVLRRVIRRIEERDLRWVVRYGVVPRNLTREFLRDVMDRPLRLALAGQSTSDWIDEDDMSDEPDDPSWSTNVLPSPDAELNLDGLFTRLKDYAAERGWISFDGGEIGQFHADVINPMRGLLRTKPVFRELHEAALRHFERLASEQPVRGQSTPARRSIIVSSSATRARRTTALEARLAAPSAADALTRWLIADEVLGRDYAEGRVVPLEIDGKPIIDQGALALAHAAAANARVLLAATAGPATLWATAAGHVRVLESAFGLTGQSAVGKGFVAAIKARQLMDARSFDEARGVLEAALSEAPDADRFPIEMLLGDMAARLKNGEAIDHFMLALDLARARIGAGDQAAILAHQAGCGVRD